MQYPHIIKHNPFLDLRIPMALLDTIIQKRARVTASRRTHSERPTISHHKWGLVNDAARTQSDFWVHQLLS